jgi:hypothetical protein
MEETGSIAHIEGSGEIRTASLDLTGGWLDVEVVEEDSKKDKIGEVHGEPKLEVSGVHTARVGVRYMEIGRGDGYSHSYNHLQKLIFAYTKKKEERERERERVSERETLSTLQYDLPRVLP